MQVFLIWTKSIKELPFNWGKLGLKIGMFMIGIGIGIIFGNIWLLPEILKKKSVIFQ